MREVTKKVTLLSDFEVHQLVKEQSAKYSNGRSGIEHLNTVQYELLRYFEKEGRPRPCMSQSGEGIQAFLAALRDADLSPPLSAGARREEHLADHHLTKAERLLLVNHVPKSEVHLNALVEECFGRFTPEQMQHMLTLIRQHLTASEHIPNGDHADVGPASDNMEDMVDEDAYLNS